MVRKHEKQVKSKKEKVKTVESAFGGRVETATLSP